MKLKVALRIPRTLKHESSVYRTEDILIVENSKAHRPIAFARVFPNAKPCVYYVVLAITVEEAERIAQQLRDIVAYLK